MRPKSLGSHEHQQTASFTLHPQRASARGVLGKIRDALDEQGGNKAEGQPPPFKTSVYCITGQIQMVRGEKGALTIDARRGVVRYMMPQREMAVSTSEGTRSALGGGLRNADIPTLIELTGNESGNAFAETSNQLIRDSLSDSESIGAVLDNVTSGLTQEWDQQVADDRSLLTTRLYQVARIVTARQAFEAERDIFYVDVGGWDMHGNIISGMETQAERVDRAIELFAKEMKAQGVWDGVVIQTASDFARTLVFNGAGTDHSWGGNHFTFGGNVKGGKMFGAFPSLDLQHSPYITDSRRGTLLPTTPWEGVWAPISEWFGVEEAKLAEVLPNINQFPPSMIVSKDDLFHEA